MLLRRPTVIVGCTFYSVIGTSLCWMVFVEPTWEGDGARVFVVVALMAVPVLFFFRDSWTRHGQLFRIPLGIMLVFGMPAFIALVEFGIVPTRDLRFSLNVNSDVLVTNNLDPNGRVFEFSLRQTTLDMMSTVIGVRLFFFFRLVCMSDLVHSPDRRRKYSN